jgi:nucleoside-diphosphate-sugar epimerase
VTVPAPVRRIAVTGAAGFLGSAVLSRLVADGFEAIGLIREGERDPGVAGAVVVSVDWSSAASLSEVLLAAQPDAVIHCAGHSGRFASEPDFEVMYEANVATVWRLCEAMSAVAPAARLVLVSSASVYGPHPPIPTRENAPLAPATHYAASKVAAEAVAAGFVARGRSIAVARPFNITGPGEVAGSVVTALASQVLAEPQGVPAVARLRENASVRDFVDVDDVARALITLARAEAAAGAYNVCSGEGVSIAELVRSAAAAWGREVRLEVADPTDPGTVSTGDPARLRALGWVPAHTLSDSLARLAAFREGRPL